MIYKASCVLEGGAMMGIYTAGVLDVLMENNIYFKNIIGVSSGSANAVNYAAGQKGRTLNCMAIEDKKLHFFGLGTLLRRHKFYDFDLCFFGFADKYVPFDYDRYNKSEIECEAVVADVDTGKSAYLKCLKRDKEMVAAARASSSLPFFSKIYSCQGHNCLDGGVTDSIPFERAQKYGHDKMVIVLTKPYGYRRYPLKRKTKILSKLFYHRYPEFLRAMEERYLNYNRELEEVEKLEKEGKVFVFRPERQFVGRMEKDRARLLTAYEAGKKDAVKRLPELLKYLE